MWWAECDWREGSRFARPHCAGLVALTQARHRTKKHLRLAENSGSTCLFAQYMTLGFEAQTARYNAARYYDLETPCALAIPSNPGSPLFATLPDRCAFPQITAHSLARSRGRFSFKPAGRIAIAADPE